MIDFERLWAEDPEADDGAEAPKGVPADALLAWERARGVTLPEPLRTALGFRNGGHVRNTSIDVSPLAEIGPVDGDFWEFTAFEENEVPDHGLLFEFGTATGTGSTLLMNFNKRGPHGSPSVYQDYHGESRYLLGDSVIDFFEDALRSSDEPSVDWSETEGDLPILAREAFDLSGMYDGLPASEEQVLTRRGETLIVFTRSLIPDQVILSRTTLPLPLDAGQAEIKPLRPGPSGTFALYLQPVESDGIVHEESETDDDGRWKNSTRDGVPIYIAFESTDADRLRSLREQLFGPEGAVRAQSKQDNQAELAKLLDTLTPEQRTAAMLRAAMTQRDEMVRRISGPDAEGAPAMPPELAAALEAMRTRLEAMTQRVHQAAAGDLPDADTIRRIQDLLRPPGDA